MQRSMCHFHADEMPEGLRQPDGSYAFTCDRADGHPTGRTWSWLEVPAPRGQDGLGGLAAELGLAVELPAAVASYDGAWVEYGLVEQAYAAAQPREFARLVEHYGHRAVAPSAYTASAFLAGCLGRLARQAALAYHDGPATGPWSPLSRVSWWAPVTTMQEFCDDRSCAAEGVTFAYVPRARTG